MSKYNDLLAVRKSKGSATQKVSKSKGQKASRPETSQPAVAPVGRPRAKRSNPDYQQVTAYIRRSDYTEARKRLFDERREFSELIGELVANWLAQESKTK